MGTTLKELVSDLQAKPKSTERDYLIILARSGYYHDFQTELAAPKIQLAVDLMKVGYPDLAEKVKQGAYDDEVPTVEQVTQIRKDVGSRVFDLLMRR